MNGDGLKIPIWLFVWLYVCGSIAVIEATMAQDKKHAREKMTASQIAVLGAAWPIAVSLAVAHSFMR